jgi:hypothetical protein
MHYEELREIEVRGVYYKYQFVASETLVPLFAPEYSTAFSNSFRTEHKSILIDSMTGTVYAGKNAIQTFVASEEGIFRFTDIGKPATKCISGHIDKFTEEIVLIWNEIPDDNYLVVSYEYWSD